MGKKPAARQPSPMWVTTADLPTSAGHPFFERLNQVLEEAGFDAFVEGLCAVFYASRLGRPSLRPGRYFRLLFIGYFEGLSSERGIAWRVADSLSLRAFLDLDVTEAPPNHSTLSRTRRLIDVETHVAVVRQANVVSNIGSFGENVYKIGLTRRLEPEDRIRELGDASVPFPFDIHAMVFSEDAPGLEQTLHRAFDDRRVNLVNARREFFAVSLPEIESAAQEHGTVEFTLAAEAEQYRKTLALREARDTPAAEVAPEAQVAADAKARLEQRRAAWA